MSAERETLLFDARLAEIRTRLERAQAAVVHTPIFKADGLVGDAMWLLRCVDQLSAVADDALHHLDLNISDEQSRELGVRIIQRCAEIGKLQ